MFKELDDCIVSAKARGEDALNKWRDWLAGRTPEQNRATLQRKRDEIISWSGQVIDKIHGPEWVRMINPDKHVHRSEYIVEQLVSNMVMLRWILSELEQLGE